MQTDDKIQSSSSLPIPFAGCISLVNFLHEEIAVFLKSNFKSGADVEILLNHLCKLGRVLQNEERFDLRVDYGDLKQKPFPKPEMRTMLKPVGPVVFFANQKSLSFVPFLIYDVVSALVVECPVVLVVPDSFDKLEMDMVALVQDCLSKAGYPQGSLECVRTNCKVSKLSLIRDREAKAVMLDANGPDEKWIDSELGKAEDSLSKFKVANASTSTILASSFENMNQNGSNQKLFRFLLNCILYEEKSEHLFLCPLEEVENWCDFFKEALQNSLHLLGIQSEKLGDSHKLLKTSSLKSYMECGRLADDKLKHIVRILGYEDLGECMQWAKSASDRVLIQVFDCTRKILDYEELLNQLEIRCQILTINEMSKIQDWMFGKRMGQPSCCSLEDGGDYEMNYLLARFCRPICFQNFPHGLLPSHLAEFKTE